MALSSLLVPDRVTYNLSVEGFGGERIMHCKVAAAEPGETLR